jgi:hypothetical protein
MPYQQTEVPSEMFMRHNGVGIYHTYKYDDMATNPPRTYWFVTDPFQGEEDSFDVRELPQWDVNVVPSPWTDPEAFDNGIKAVLIAAIDAGILTTDGMQVTA